jgi:predicted component of type VI protein secretion system
MPAQLVALNDGPNILLDKPILLIGRHQECDIQINGRKVSRRHCCIAQVGEEFIVRDLGSTNGIRINGVRVAEGRLKGGDELTIGNHRYQLSWDSTSSLRPPKVEAKKAAPAAKAPVDEVLESWDEPVPLVESAETPPRLPPRGIPLATPLNPTMAGHPTAAPSDLPMAEAIVPEDLKLAPASGEHPAPKVTPDSGPATDSSDS